ncbi:MAG: CAP domain-containing protein [Chitinophagaceae bacterium]
MTYFFWILFYVQTIFFAASNVPHLPQGTKQLAASSNAPVTADAVVAEVNRYRVEKGLAPLKILPFANEMAQQHSTAMALGKVPFSHNGFEQRIQSIQKKESRFIERSAENVAYGYLTVNDLVAGWIRSNGHRKNIEGAGFNYTGVGIAANENGMFYYTQIFLSLQE